MPRWNIVATDNAAPGREVSAKGYIELLDAWNQAQGAGAFRVDDAGNITANSVTLTNPVSGQYLATSQYASSGQTTLTTASATFAAVSSTNVNTGSFTAPPSGSVLVGANFIMQTSASADQVGFGLCAHGTITPMIGFIQVFKAPNTTQPGSCSLEFLVTGLTAGTSYNFDLMFCIASAGTLTVYSENQTGTSPTLSNAGIGSPVVMTVQAI